MWTAAGFLLSVNVTGTTSACLLHPSQRSRGHLRLPPRVTCRQQVREDGPGDDARRQQHSLLLDRRDMLIGLGGLYGAAAGPMAVAAPVMPPDLNYCHDANLDSTPLDRHCCPPNKPPYTDAMIEDYDFPMTPLRERRPAHLVKDDKEYMDKYKLAVARMKALDKDHPWNFNRQGKFHCLYCNDAYDQQGSSSGAHIQVHNSWLFFPWHRFYVHFYERILGKLIEDDTFTIPFWNFDAKDGMTFPRIYEEQYSSLHDGNRNKCHVKEGGLFDYKYSYDKDDGCGNNDCEVIQDNLSYMKKAFRHGLPLPELFMGDPLRGGQPATEGDSSSGYVEVIHNTAHIWVGLSDHKYKIDMGNLSTSALDPAFFSLHTNVDRLWDIYRNLRGNKVEFDDPDWLDSSFLFWDENMKLVRVKVKDSLDPLKLRYTYAPVPHSWLGQVSRPRTTETKDKSTTDLPLSPVDEFGTHPRKLEAETPLRVMVARPKTNRKKAEKEKEVEVLHIKGIEVATADSSRFDVYITAPSGDLAGPDFGEFAGSFVRLRHTITMKGGMKSGVKRGGLKLGLNSLLEDIEAEDAEKLVVTLVLRSGDITVGGVHIKLLQADTTSGV